MWENSLASTRMLRKVSLTLIAVCALLIAPTTAWSNGLVKTEKDLQEAIASRARVVLGASITLTEELPPISTPVTIVGHAKACKQSSCSLDAQQKFRHLTVTSGGSLSMYNLELRNGKSLDNDGGAILVTDGSSLELNSVMFTQNNVALFSIGGAVCVRNGSSANIYNSHFIKNSGGFGGAVGVSESSKADIRNSVFEQNVATLSGGGLECMSNSSALLADNFYQGNSATIGGATTTHDSLINICGASFVSNMGSLDGPNVMLEGAATVTFCKTSKQYITGYAAEDCSPCAAVGPSPGVRGDPHIRGPHGETFDFHGTPEQSYCLISDGYLQLNMKIMAGYKKSSTFIRELGLVFFDQRILVSSAWSRRNNETEHQGTVIVNEEELPKESGSWVLPHDLELSRTRNEVIVEVRKRFRMSFRVVKAMHRAAAPFLNLRIAYFFPATTSVDGVFGQLYKPTPNNMQFVGHGRFKSLSNSESYRVSSTLWKD